LSRTAYKSPIQDRRLTLEDSLFQDGALVLDQLASRRALYGISGRPGIEISFPQMPHLGIWTKPHAGFICIEPWQGYASPEGFDGEFADRPGVVLIPRGGQRRFWMDLSLRVNLPESARSAP
jgi:galactose mutarotase-like enzyme